MIPACARWLIALSPARPHDSRSPMICRNSRRLGRAAHGSVGQNRAAGRRAARTCSRLGVILYLARCRPSRSARGKTISRTCRCSDRRTSPSPRPSPRKRGEGVLRGFASATPISPSLVCLPSISPSPKLPQRMLSVRHARVDFRSCRRVGCLRCRGRRGATLAIPCCFPAGTRSRENIFPARTVREFGATA